MSFLLAKILSLYYRLYSLLSDSFTLIIINLQREHFGNTTETSRVRRGYADLMALMHLEFHNSVFSNHFFRNFYKPAS